MNVKLEDLYIQCDKCGGTGHYSESFLPSQGTYGRRLVGSTGPCEKCSGAGGHLTEDGKVLKQFMSILRIKFPGG